MTTEQAIAYIKNPIGKNFEAHAEFERAAIAALREKAEREKGCEYCNTENNRYLTDDVYLASTNFFGLNRQRVITSQDGSEYKVLLYCPMCGRRLEEN